MSTHTVLREEDSCGGPPASPQLSSWLLGYGYRRAGYSRWSVGEILANARAGTVAAAPQGVVFLWMHSAAHRRVILSGAFRDAGIGIHRAGGRGYFTLDLGRRGR